VSHYKSNVRDQVFNLFEVRLDKRSARASTANSMPTPSARC
jgi:hypothetical protein